MLFFKKMKKVIGIVVLLVIAASGLYISIDHHYCGGSPYGVKISLSGELASCGMESPQKTSGQGTSFEKRCCEDHLTVYHYSPDYFQIDEASCSISKQLLPCHPVIAHLTPVQAVDEFSSEFIPPGPAIKSQNTLNKTCILRI